MPIQIPTVQTGLEASIQAAAQKAGKNLKINLGANSRSIEALSQPLGRITGKADEFTKSMEAANARVLAFGASVGVLSAITRAFKDLVTTTIEVEKSLANINSILNVSSTNLAKFKKEIFDVARNTEQTFATVADAALDLSRQGLKAAEVTSRLNDAMILARLSGLGASEAVSGLTAAINSFNREGLTSEQVLNKIAAAAVSAAVSERDLIEGIKRSGSVAIEAGVSFDELVGVISALQQRTARGGSVIGNSLKTIFTRLQSLEKLKTMQELGTEITDASGAILPATKLIDNLATAIRGLPDTRKLQIAENLVGKFQVAPFLALLSDYNSQTRTAIELTKISQGATTEAYERNVVLNKTLSAAINQATTNLKELANTLGEIGVTDSLKNILSFFNSLVGNIKDLLEGEGLGSDFARGIVKGIGAVISGPGLAIFAAIIAKLTIDLAKFGAASLKTFFGLNKTAKDIAATQGAIASSLLKNSEIQKQILAIENSTLSVEQKRAAQTQFFTTALNAQLGTMKQMQAIAASIAPAVVAGGRAGSAGRARGRAAGGFVPNFDAVRGYGSDRKIPNFDAVRGYGAERRDINRGVGGASSAARPVTIPNFNFGGGQRGTMVANTSEFIVPNYAGGGSAIYNQDMASSMGLPSGARSLAAGGYIPNFARFFDIGKFKNLRANQVADKLKKGEITKQQAQKAGYAPSATPTFGMGVKGPGIFDFPASSLGIASMFAGKKSDNTRMATTTLTGQAAMVAKRDFPGVKEFRFRGLQIRSLNDATKDVRKQKQEGKYRRKLEELFLEPLARLGSSLVGPPPQGAGFAADELSKINSQTRSRKTDPDIFSTSVQGGLFEAAIRLFTKGVSGIPEFRSHSTEQAPFDFEESGTANEHFKKAFGFTGALRKADAKRSATSEAVRTIIPKALNDVQTRTRMKRFFNNRRSRATKGGGRANVGGFMGRAAEGYIPNFASSPLQDAIIREKEAGLPINQIRVNQDARLRNAGNPMGLAVTNTRDEPTGSISAAGGYVPNFQTGRSSFVSSPMGTQKFADNINKSAVKVEKAAGKMADKMLGAMFAASMLSGAFSNTESAFGKTMEQFGKSVMNASIAMMALSLLPENVSGKFKTFGKSLVQAGVAVFVAAEAFKFLNALVMNTQSSLLANAKAHDHVAKAAERAAINLGMLGAGDKAEVQARTTSGIRDALEASRTLSKFNPRDFTVFGRIGDAMRGDFGNKRTSTGGVDFFKGADEGRMKGLLDAADVAVAGGARTEEVMDIVSRIASESGTGDLITEKEFVQMVKEISTLTQRLTPENFAKGFEAVDPEGKRRGSLRKLQADMEEAQGAGEAGAAIRLENQFLTEQKKLKDDLRKQLEINDIAAEAGIAAELKGLKKLGTETEKLTKAEAKRIATTKAIGVIENAGVLLAARLNVVSAVERELEMTKALGQASADQVASLETQVQLEKVNEKSMLATHKAMEQVAKLTQEVTVDQEKAASFAKLIQNLTFDQVDTDEKRKKVIEEIAEATGVSTAKIDNQVQLILNGVNANEKFLDSERRKVKEAEKFNKLKREALDLQKAELLTAQALLSKGENAAKAAFAKRQADLQIAGARRQIGGNTRNVIQERAAGVLSAQDSVSGAKLNLEERRDQNLRGGLRELGAFGDKNDAVRRSVENLFEQRAAEGTPEQRRQFSQLFSSTTGDTATMFVALANNSADLQKVMEELVVDMKANGVATKTEIKEAEQLIEKYKSLSVVTEEQGRGALQAAEALLKVAENAGKVPSMSTLAINRADELEKGKTAAQFEANLTTDPFARARKQVAIDSTDKIAAAIKVQDFALARQLQQADQLTLTMIDGADQFANKLGSAMHQAIRDGGSFGDALKSAGLTFLDHISQAMMQMAAKQVTSSIMGGIMSGFSSGGMVRGGSGRKDDVPAMLMGGEFVMSKAAVSDYGLNFMKQVNDRRVRGFASGGAVGGRDLFDPAFSGRALRGKGQLMGFAGQGVTSGAGDFMRGGAGASGSFGAVSLQPGSIRGTQFQRRTDSMAKQRTEARSNALNLYFQQLSSEKQRQEAWDAEQQRLLEERIRQEEAERQRKAQEAKQREAARKAKKRSIWSTVLGVVGAVVAGPVGYAVGSAVGGAVGGRATGGYAQGGGFGPIGRMLGMGAFAGGGPQGGARSRGGGSSQGAVRPSAGVDSVATMLTGGEFIMNAAATRRIGQGNLSALNSGVGGASGGSNSAFMGAIGQLIGRQSDSKNNITITVNTDGTQNTSVGRGSSGSALSLAARIRDAVTEIIAQEKRLGGTLRSG